MAGQRGSALRKKAHQTIFLCVHKYFAYPSAAVLVCSALSTRSLMVANGKEINGEINDFFVANLIAVWYRCCSHLVLSVSQTYKAAN